MKAIGSNSRSLGVMILLAALGACVAPKAPPPPPAPAPLPAPRPAPTPSPPPPPADWRDAAQTPGTWRWSADAGRSTAIFAATGASPIASLTCDKPAGLVLLGRAVPSTEAVSFEVITSTLARALLSDPARSPIGWTAVALPVRDPLLDAMAFSRGRFALEMQGQPTLYLPSWPELSRVIEDCR